MRVIYKKIVKFRKQNERPCLVYSSVKKRPILQLKGMAKF